MKPVQFDIYALRNDASQHCVVFYVLLHLYNQVFYLVGYDQSGQCKSTGGCYNELMVAIFRPGAGIKGKKIYTC